MTSDATVELSTLSRKEVMDMIRGKIRRQLSRLGSTEQEVARTLLDNQCYGWRRESRSDPVAMWLSKTLTIGGDIQVYYDYVKVTSAVESYVVCVDLPQPVMEFVASFDQLGEYRELDMEKVAARNDGWDDGGWVSAWNSMHLNPAT